MFLIIIGVLAAVVLAMLEIQIEGRDGWARKLPTWRWKARWFALIPGGNKELTGYHLYLWLFVGLMAQLMLAGRGWSLGGELVVMAWIIGVLRLEDFLWFVFNPAYGLGKFRRGEVEWHSDWWGPLPAQYYWSMAVVAGLLLAAYYLV